MLGSVLTFLVLFVRKFAPLIIMVQERTFIAVKPDGVQRGLTGEIIKRFEAKGFKMAGMKFLQASEEHLKNHYSDLSDKPFFAGLVKYMASGPLVAMCWEGTGVVKTARVMMGETRPADSKPGTIRGDFCIEVGRNIIHGSDSVESANKEIALWFKPEELVSWTQASHDWIYEFLDRLGDLNNDKGLSILNKYLEDKSYIQGYTSSRSDMVVFSSIQKQVVQPNHPHVYRWMKHIRSICTELETSSESFCRSWNNLDNKSNVGTNITLKSQPSTVINEKKKVQQEEITFKPNVYAVLLQVLAKDEETNMKDLENVVRASSMDGLKWGNSQLVQLSFGLKKLSIICTVEDDKASIQDVIQRLAKHEEYIKSVDIAAFNKL